MSVSNEQIQIDLRKEEAAQLATYVAMLHFIRRQLPLISDYVEHNTHEIIHRFKQLSAETTHRSEQLEKVIKVAREIEYNGQTIPFERSVEIFYAPLSEAVENILEVSKLAMSMVMTVGNAAENINRVEDLIEQVQQLTKQTNMLAMNTQIEAARAGEHGKSFRIIAQEVKNLSENIRTLSQDMRKEVKLVSNSVKQSFEVTDKLASYDMTENLELKPKIDELIRSILARNDDFTALLNDYALHSRQTADSINALVVGIQFQDRTSQRLADLIALLGIAIPHFDTHIWLEKGLPLNGSSALYEAFIREAMQHIKLSDTQQQYLAELSRLGLIPPESELAQMIRSVDESAESLERADDGEIEFF